MIPEHDEPLPAPPPPPHRADTAERVLAAIAFEIDRATLALWTAVDDLSGRSITDPSVDRAYCALPAAADGLAVARDAVRHVARLLGAVEVGLRSPMFDP